MAAKKRTGRKSGAQSKRATGRTSRTRAPTGQRAGDGGYTPKDRAEKMAIVVEQLRDVPLYWMAAAEALIHPDTLAAWRREDPAFDLECRKARGEAVRPYVHRLRSQDAATSAGAARYLEKVAPAEFRRDDFIDDQLQTQTRPVRVEFVARKA